jgi:hypothetical protein
MMARNVNQEVSTRAEAGGTTSGGPRASWFAAGATTAAVTGGLFATLHLAFVIGWSLEGRTSASGWLVIGVGAIAGGIAGGLAIGIQRRASIPWLVAPLIALALLMLGGIMAWVILTPFDPNGSLRYGLALSAPFAAISIVSGTTIVALTKPARWLRVAGVAGALTAVSLMIGVVATG